MDFTNEYYAEKSQYVFECNGCKTIEIGTTKPLSVVIEPDSSVTNYLILYIKNKGDTININYYRVIPIPMPTIEIWSKGYEFSKTGIPIDSVKQIDRVKVKPEERYAVYNPADARFKIKDITYSILRNGKIFKADTLMGNEFVIPLHQAKKGDILEVEILKLYRYRYNKDIELFPTPEKLQVIISAVVGLMTNNPPKLDVKSV
jgi:hypothetical protein